MVMANSISSSLLLQEKISCSNTIKRVLSLIILFLYICLICYRIQSQKGYGTIWWFALFCESWFAFIWAVNVSNNWNPVKYITYPEHLLKRFDDLPQVDIFVTTADPVLEPPIITVNTVLSLLALEYPTNKLACYVSDDAASCITFYCLVEAAKFAKLWVPYCKKYNVQVRAPFKYYSKDEHNAASPLAPEFRQEWQTMKIEYETLAAKVEEAAQNSIPCNATGEFSTFSKIERGNHPSIVKVIWENMKNVADEVPHLIYLSREKRPQHPHHFKAGAMNALTRVSGVMTNARFMLNVDCDMFANNPEIVLHAMCLHLGFKRERECPFVQCPQLFYGGIKDDPFGNQMVVWQNYLLCGIAGIQGPNYCGTGCFHRRKATYGLSPDEAEFTTDTLNQEVLKQRFGNSKELTRSVEQQFSKMNELSDSPSNISSSLKAALEVSDCSYESNTQWGTEVGWVYGSATEDVLTGQRIHAKGWSTVYCKPDPVPFLGCAPSAGPVINIQQKRWATGLLEIFFSRKNPIFATVFGDLWFRQCLVYISICMWGLGSIPEVIYNILPAYSLLNNISFLPKASEPAVLVIMLQFILRNIYTLSEYLGSGLSVLSWWNNQKMSMISALSGRLFGILAIVLKLLGLSETVFEVTPKNQNPSDDHDSKADPGRFTFNDSPMFVPGTTIVIIHMVALFVGLVRFHSLGSIDLSKSGMPEIIASAWVLLNFMPFVKGLYRKGKHGIPSSVIYKSVALTGIFVQFCIWRSKA